MDRNLGADDLPAILRAAGFRVEVHDDVYYGRQDVLDPDIIAHCGKNRWFLLTGDIDLLTRYSEEIRRAALGVFCQANNHDGPKLWGPRIIAARNAIVRAANVRQRPFAAMITLKAKLKFRPT